MPQHQTKKRVGLSFSRLPDLYETLSRVPLYYFHQRLRDDLHLDGNGEEEADPEPQKPLGSGRKRCSDWLEPGRQQPPHKPQRAAAKDKAPSAPLEDGRSRPRRSGAEAAATRSKEALNAVDDIGGRFSSGPTHCIGALAFSSFSISIQRLQRLTTSPLSNYSGPVHRPASGFRGLCYTGQAAVGELGPGLPFFN